MENSKKFSNTVSVPFVLGKDFRNLDIACWDEWIALVFESPPPSKTQYSSDIALYSGYYVIISDSIEQNYLRINFEKT